MSTFAITGMGRSGTKFLAQILATVPGWRIQHEPYHGFQPFSTIQARFALCLGNYGEVNSYLRFHIIPLCVDIKFVILRNPLDIFASMYNRGNFNLSHLQDALLALDAAIISGIGTIAFSRMTTDSAYVRQIADKMDMVLPDVLDMSPKNVSKRRLTMPDSLQRQAQKELAWFSRYSNRW